MGIELATRCGSQASRQMRGSKKPDVGGSLRCLGPVARSGELRTKAKRKAGGTTFRKVTHGWGRYVRLATGRAQEQGLSPGRWVSRTRLVPSHGGVRSGAYGQKPLSPGSQPAFHFYSAPFPPDKLLPEAYERVKHITPCSAPSLPSFWPGSDKNLNLWAWHIVYTLEIRAIIVAVVILISASPCIRSFPPQTHTDTSSSARC